MFNGNLGLFNTEHEYLIMLKYCNMNSLRRRFKKTILGYYEIDEWFVTTPNKANG
jgi:hypothetical protein